MVYVLFGVSGWLVVLAAIIICGRLLQASHRLAGAARTAIDGVEAPAAVWSAGQSATTICRPGGWQRSGWSLNRRHLAAVIVADPD